MLFTNVMSTTSSVTYVEIFFQILNVIFIFLLVIFLAYITTKIIAGKKIKTMKGNNMQIIETIPLGFNSLHILKVNEKFYLISSSKEGIQYLTELNKDDISLDNFENTVSFEENLKLYLKKAKDKIGGKNEK